GDEHCRGGEHRLCRRIARLLLRQWRRTAGTPRASSRRLGAQGCPGGLEEAPALLQSRRQGAQRQALAGIFLREGTPRMSLEAICRTDAEVVFFPVRHHSPACARLVRALIGDLSPSALLIEGPSDFNPRIAELELPHQLPIAIYSYVR